MEERKPSYNRINKTNTNSNSKAIQGGRIPPQATDLEEAVLGAMMLEKTAVNDAIDILKPDSFYKTAHQRVFEAIQELFQKSEPVDILTVTSTLRQNGTLEMVGGAYYVSQLTNRVASAANVEYYSRIIAQKFIQRELIRISTNIVNLAYDETSDVFELMDKAESELFSVAEGNIRKSYDSLGSVLQKAIEEIEDARNQEDGVSGVPTGFHDLDKVTAGWQRTDMIVIAARPGMGKTAFVLSMARNISVEFGQAAVIFSLEMAAVQIVNRLISSETGISGEKLRKGTLTEQEYQVLHSRIGRLAEAPLFIDDTPALSIFELRAKCRRLKAQHDIQIVIIDYLQLMTAGGSGGNREQEISTISRSIKEIAKECDIPIIALSQLSRSVETRGGDKKPMLSDLRESGAIEQDADIVSFIYRPEYYGITEDEEGNSTVGTGEIIIAKHRNGSLDNVRLRFIPQLVKFDNLDSFSYENQMNSAGMLPNADFDEQAPTEEAPQTITMSSKLNNWDGDDDNFDWTPEKDDNDQF